MLCREIRKEGREFWKEEAGVMVFIWVVREGFLVRIDDRVLRRKLDIWRDYSKVRVLR